MQEFLLSVDDAGANVNRSVALAGTSIAIFTFTLGFFYPRLSFLSSDNLTLFQIALTVIGLAIFSLVISGVYFYAVTLVPLHDRTKADKYRRRADTLWLVGFSLLVLEPSLILFTVGLTAVADVYLVMWIGYVVFQFYMFAEIQSLRRKANPMNASN